jgi:hypothetical protein
VHQIEPNLHTTSCVHKDHVNELFAGVLDSGFRDLTEENQSISH